MTVLRANGNLQKVAEPSAVTVKRGGPSPAD